MRPLVAVVVLAAALAAVMAALMRGFVDDAVVSLSAEGPPDGIRPASVAKVVPPPTLDVPPDANTEADAPREGPMHATFPRPPSASTAPKPPFRGGFDAVFVEREDVWWLVDDGAHRAQAPPWTLATEDVGTLDAAAARAILDAIEAGEGGGYVERTGLGPPAAPWPDAFAGIELVAVARDLATVLRSDDAGVEHVVLATRLAESDDRAGDDARHDEGAAHTIGVRARSPRPATVVRAQSPLVAARRRALEGDAPETLRLIGLAGFREASSAPAPLAAIAAQALERLGRFREAADCLRRVADATSDPRLLGRVLDLEARARVRAGDLDGARSAREDADDLGADAARPFDALDAALGALPTLVRAGRPHDAVAGVAHALSSPATPASNRSPRRRRAMLATAALALEAGDLDAAAFLLRHGSAPPLPAALAAVVGRLAQTLAARRPQTGTSARPRPSDAARGVGKRPRGG